MCSECGEQFQDHASNLTHWKDKHPGKDISKRISKLVFHFSLNNIFQDVPTVISFSVTAQLLFFIFICSFVDKDVMYCYEFSVCDA